MKKFFISLLLLVTSVVSSENIKDVAQKPATKLEELTSIKGSILIQSFQKIGTLNAKYSSQIKVRIYEFSDEKSKSKTYGLGIEVETGDKYNNSASSYIDFDEIPSLIKGLEFISGIQKNPTNLENYEAKYQTRGGLEVINFNSFEGIQAVIKAGRYNAKNAFIELKDLHIFKTMIEDSHKKLQELKNK